jgi:glycosyltransferase involved in cell wall biosynthesis
MASSADTSTDRGPVKVSVIVPTYCTGAGLTRVLDSLDQQTMSQDDFESVFVDDGSPDDTLERLTAFAQERSQMRVTSIPNSGWPSRPRNVGLGMATGDYVVFMDHDDELYPDALRDAWAYAEEHRLDVLTAREMKSDSPYFSWDAFLRDVAPPDLHGPRLLAPMTPHKLYRRQFLLDHEIAFPETGPAGVRVRWEDIHFNIDVYRHAQRLGVLASTPFYRWILRTGANNSMSFTEGPDEFWPHLAGVFEHLDAAGLAESDADWIRLTNYSHRVLQVMVGPASLQREADYNARTWELAADFARQWVPPRIDERLEHAARVRSALLRGGHSKLFEPLAEADRGVKVEPVATRLDLSGGRIRLLCRATWVDGRGEPLPLRRHLGHLSRVLPEEVLDAVGPSLLDLDEALARATSRVSVAGRDTQISWPVETSFEHRLQDLPDGRVLLQTEATAELDVRSGALGRPLADDRWQVGCRCSFAGFHSQPFVQYDGPTLVALVEDRVVVASSSRFGNLLVDVHSDVRAVFRNTAPDVDGARVRRGGRLLVVPIPHAEHAGETRLPVRFRLRRLEGRGGVNGTGSLVADEQGARLELDLSRGKLTRGSYRLLVDAAGKGWGRGRGWVTEVVVNVGRGGRVARSTATSRPVHRSNRPLWGSGVPSGAAQDGSRTGG